MKTLSPFLTGLLLPFSSKMRSSATNRHDPKDPFNRIPSRDVAKELFVGLYALGLGQTVDLGQMLLAFGRQVKVEDLAKELTGACDQGARRWNDMTPSHVARTRAGADKTLDELDAVFVERLVTRLHVVDKPRDDTARRR